MIWIVIAILALWVIAATAVSVKYLGIISDFSLRLGAIDLSLDKLEKHVQPLATLKATLDKERYDREKMALIQGDEDRRDWKSV